MEDKERTLTEAEADEPECKSEQKPEPRTEENSEQNAPCADDIRIFKR